LKGIIHAPKQNMGLVKYLLSYHPHTSWFWYTLILLILLFFLGVLIVRFLDGPHAFSLRRVIVAAIVLIIIDQAIQVIMIKNHAAINISIIDGWLGIFPQPMLGTNAGYVSIADIVGSRNQLIGILVIIVFFYYVFRCSYYFLPHKRLLSLCIVLFAAGISCSFLDTCLEILVHNYGYDYIEIEYIECLDIKDMYLSLWLSTMLLFIIKNYSIYKRAQIKKEYVLAFLRWEYNSWRSLYSNVRITILKILKISYN
jgi:hypothetical protein